MSDFYKQITNENAREYQRFFEKILEKVNIDVFTRWLDSTPELIKGEYESSASLVLDVLYEARKKDLDQTIILVAFLQFAKADSIEQEKQKHKWFRVIKNRKKIDFFPDEEAVLSVLEKIGILK